jgi:glucokinase
MLALAIDFGGSHFSCAIVRDTEILARRENRIAADSFRAAQLLVERLADEAAAASGVGLRDCSGLVIGFPGIVDSRQRKIVSTNAKYDDALGIDVPAWSKSAFGLPLFLDNDARLALMGEQWCGAARGAEDAVLITLGTGIGAAAMLGGRPLRGRFDEAGCLGGHIPVVLGGRRCTCGNVGCAEAEASTWALPEICREWPGFNQSRLASLPVLNFEALFAAADSHDPVARAILAHCCHVWAVLSVALVHAYSPEMLVFAGGVMARAPEILPVIQRHVEQHAWTPRGQVAIARSALGSAAPLHGAIPLILEMTR